MDGRLREAAAGRGSRCCPRPACRTTPPSSPAATDALQCLWFGGSLEGKSDISIYRSTLGADGWSAGRAALSTIRARSEQNPVQFDAPDGRRLILHTAPAGRQPGRLRRPHARGRGKPPHDLRAARRHLHPRPHPRPRRRRLAAAALPLRLRARASAGPAATTPPPLGDQRRRRPDLARGRGPRLHRLRPHDPRARSAAAASPPSTAAARPTSSTAAKAPTAAKPGPRPEPTDVPNNNSSISAIRLARRPRRHGLQPGQRRDAPRRRAAPRSMTSSATATTAPTPTGGCEPVWGVPRAPLSLCLSEDGGRTFPRRIVVDDSPGTCLSNNSLNGRKLRALLSLADPAGRTGRSTLAYTYFRRAIKHVRLSTTGWTTRMIGITMGDPAGVGPEITLKAVAEMAPDDRAAHPHLRLPRDARSRAEGHRHHSTSTPTSPSPTCPVEGGPLPFGKADPRAGDAAFRFIEAAVRAARGERDRLHRHRADQQGRAQRRRPPLRRPHRDARRPHRREARLHAARLRPAQGDPRLHPCQPARGDLPRHSPSRCWPPSAPATST